MDLAATRALVRAAADEHHAVLVALSGGKDSLCILELCRAAFARVEAFCMRLVPGLECVERPAQTAADRAGVPLHFVEHPMASRYRALGICGWHRGRPERRSKQIDVEAELRARTGIHLLAYGHRQADSPQRRAMLRRLSPHGIDGRGGRIYPCWDWTTRDVLAYLRFHRIPVPERIGAAGQSRSSGLSLNRTEVLWLYEHHRSDYETLEREFPFVGVWVARDRFGQQDAGVHD